MLQYLGVDVAQEVRSVEWICSSDFLSDVLVERKERIHRKQRGVAAWHEEAAQICRANNRSALMGVAQLIPDEAHDQTHHH